MKVLRQPSAILKPPHVTTSAANLPSDHRIPQLDGLRAIAMLSVFVFHVWEAPLTWIGVDFFFVLSGFLITGILLQRKGAPGYFRHFFSRRARRILAPYFLLLVLSSVLFGTAWLREWYWYVLPASNIPNALGHVPHLSLDPLWSLAVEEQFYLVWPVVVLLVPEAALGWIAGGLILLAPCLRGVATNWVSSTAPIFHLTPFRMDLLAAGALIAVMWRKWPGKARLAFPFGVILISAAGAPLLILSRFPWFRTSVNSAFVNVTLYSLTLLISAGVLLWCLSGKGVLPTVLKTGVLRYLGRISYSMYLIHVCFIVLAEQWLAASDWVVGGVSFALTVGYSSLSWHWLERPLQSGGKA